MNYFLGFNEVSIHGHYTKYPNQSFEISIIESDIYIWKKYIIPLFNNPNFYEYLNNDAAWIWPVSDFSKYTSVDSDNNFLRVKKTCYICDDEQMGRIETPYELNVMNSGSEQLIMDKFFQIDLRQQERLEDEIYLKTKLNEKLRRHFLER